MKILHTSDWHLGRTFHRHSLHEWHQRFIDELIDYATAEKIDVLLISGDVYDSAHPSAETTELLGKTLDRLALAGIQVVLSAGNHDSARRLGYGAGTLARQGIYPVTTLKETFEPVELTRDDIRVRIYAVPYLNPRYYGRQLDIEPTHAAVLGNVCTRIREDNEKRNAGENPADFTIVMAHATVSEHGDFDESVRSSSERNISVGGVDWAPAALFEGFDYTALGHIHRRYPVTDRVQYSGSPLPFSFSEEANKNGAYLLNLTSREGCVKVQIESHEWRTRLPLKTLTGTFDELMGSDEFSPYETEYFCRIILRDDKQPVGTLDELRKRYENIASFVFEPLHQQPRANTRPRITETTNPAHVCEEFYATVRAHPLEAAETRALEHIVDEVISSGRSA